MIAVIQRVNESSVTISGNIRGAIKKGLLILLGVEEADRQEDIDWLTSKIAQLRIFSDQNGKMNLSCIDVNGDYLIISQFTLQASIKKGNRPSYIKAAKPETAIPLYDSFISTLSGVTSKNIKSGEFGADMQVSLVNDGPVTIIIDTKNRK